MEANFAPSRAIINFDVTLSMDVESILAIIQTEKLRNENIWFIHKPTKKRWFSPGIAYNIKSKISTFNSPFLCYNLTTYINLYISNIYQWKNQTSINDSCLAIGHQLTHTNAVTLILYYFSLSSIYIKNNIKIILNTHELQIQL